MRIPPVRSKQATAGPRGGLTLPHPSSMMAHGSPEAMGKRLEEIIQEGPDSVFGDTPAKGTGQSVERCEVSLNTPAGQLTRPVEVPTGFVPVTAIVPLLRHLGEEAQDLEVKRSLAAGAPISCQKGCAACCRMLIPVSPPEAFALRDMVARLPEPRRQAVLDRLAKAKQRLQEKELLDRLNDVAETTRQLSDEEMEPVNRAYYGLRLPCAFLEEEACSIYEDRPAACRELLVTSPAELCQDMVNNHVRALPIPIRMGTALAMLWADLTGGPTRFIALPLALDWADRHAETNRPTWTGPQLLEKALDKVWRYLSWEFESRRKAAASTQSGRVE